jgi:hypothetical protein
MQGAESSGGGRRVPLFCVDAWGGGAKSVNVAMGYNARNDEIRDNIARMQREWEADGRPDDCAHFDKRSARNIVWLNILSTG